MIIFMGDISNAEVKVVGPVENILKTPFDLKPAVEYIQRHKPKPDSTSWEPNPNSKVFRKDGNWIIREVYPEPTRRFVIELHIRDDARQLFVLRRELDGENKDVTQLTAMITEAYDSSGSTSLVCLDGAKQLTNPQSIMHYVNAMLTYSLGT